MNRTNLERIQQVLADLPDLAIRQDLWDDVEWNAVMRVEDTLKAAADEIERLLAGDRLPSEVTYVNALKAEIERLRAALHRIAGPVAS